MTRPVPVVALILWFGTAIINHKNEALNLPTIPYEHITVLQSPTNAISTAACDQQPLA